ncbi:MAG: ribosome maturation factor RimP [Eubacteriales bacterium]|nr:ribosome maturation factor RimP [Eubacteriales bacterium]MDD4421679.1 ribosome maturation factor RimP [Eubacteriales bacterium]
MSNKKQNTASQVRALVEKPISEMGFSLWDVAYYKEGAELILEVSVDKKGGISLDDCSDITKKIEPIIDELDPISEPYCLMVSSAGIDRELRNDEQIGAAKDGGYTVNFKLFSLLEGRKEYYGTIKSFDNDIITIERNDETGDISLPRKLISKMTACFGIV